jgi:hypothetical protein
LLTGTGSDLSGLIQRLTFPVHRLLHLLTCPRYHLLISQTSALPAASYIQQHPAVSGIDTTFETKRLLGLQELVSEPPQQVLGVDDTVDKTPIRSNRRLSASKSKCTTTDGMSLFED